MSEHDKQQPTGSVPAAPVAAVPAAPALDPNALMALIQLLLAQQQEAMLDRQEKSRAREAREKQHRLNSQYNEQETKQKQSICTHKKGGRSGPRGKNLDYAVYFHTFINGESYVRCLICGMKWKPADTTDFLTRRGQKVPNHTGIGWRDAVKMLGESTNTASKSEILIRPDDPDIKDFQDFKNNPHAVEI